MSTPLFPANRLLACRVGSTRSLASSQSVALTDLSIGVITGKTAD
jgi:hypothetical protein